MSLLGKAITDRQGEKMKEFDTELRKIVLGDVPDTFLSDNLIDKPYRVKKLLLETIEKASPEERDETIHIAQPVGVRDAISIAHENSAFNAGAETFRRNLLREIKGDE